LAVAALAETWRGAFERAAALLEEGLTLGREAGDAKAMAMVQLSLGHLALHRGEWDAAVTHLTDALARWRALGESHWIVGALYRLGYVARLRGDHEESSAWHAESLDEARTRGWAVPIAYSLEALGTCARERGDDREAALLFAEALTIARDHRQPGTVANCLKSLGAVAAVDGKAEQAARLFGAFEAMLERQGRGEPPPGERVFLERDGAPARDQLPGDTFAAAWAAGRVLSLDHAVAEAFEVASEFASKQPAITEPPAGLTPRELDVLRLLVEGISDKEIADALEISRRTASKHVKTILSKLDVPSRTAAATYATRHGMV
jgi:DNA-binding CsgD family transcriptional regulator/tetratricopeptide (TPR) repeat protein